MLCELVDTTGLPLGRRVRRFTKCRRCGWWKRMPIDKATVARVSRTPGVLGRILTTWVLLAAIIPGSIVFYFTLQQLYREHAEQPMVGDRLTIHTREWPSARFERASRYTVLEVTAVNDEWVELAGCGLSANESSKIERRCKGFPEVMPSVERARLPELFDDGAIKSISRSDDSFAYWWGLLGMWGLLLVANGILSDRYLRQLR